MKSQEDIDVQESSICLLQQNVLPRLLFQSVNVHYYTVENNNTVCYDTIGGDNDMWEIEI